MVVAEIGLNHFGSMREAKTLIRAANDSGADIIKSQAFLAHHHVGTMPRKFYEQCQFLLKQYIELIHYARELKTDLFYSIFSPEFEALKHVQSWHKVTGEQTRKGLAIEFFDQDNVLISVPEGVGVFAFKKATIMHVTDYLTQNPNLERIVNLKLMLRRDDIGFSDHTVGIENCLKAIEYYGVPVIEKHFCLMQHRSWGNQIFRDTVHGATPKAFQRIVLAMG